MKKKYFYQRFPVLTDFNINYFLLIGVIFLLFGPLAIPTGLNSNFESRKLSILFFLMGFLAEIIKFAGNIAGFHSPRLKCKIILNNLTNIISNDLLFINIYFFSIFFATVFSFSNVNEYLIIYIAGFIALYSVYLSFRDTTPSHHKLLLKIFCGIFIITGTVFSLISIYLATFGTIGIEAIRGIITEKMYSKVAFEMQRGRIFPLFPIELLGVFTISYLIESIQKSGVYSIKSQLLYISSFLAFIAISLNNYRSHILAGAIGLIILLKLTKALRYSRLLLMPFIISILLTGFLLPTNPIKRFLMIDKQDSENILLRLENLNLSFQILRNNIFFGSGIGNAQNYLEIEDTTVVSADQHNPVLYKAYQHPHNFYALTLAETGILGFTSLMLLVINFISSDLKSIDSDKDHTPIYAFIVSSWIFLIGSFLDWYPAHSLIFFFVIRGIIMGYQRLYCDEKKFINISIP